MSEHLTDQQIGEIERGWNKPYDCNVCLGLSPSWDGHDRTCRGRVWESVPLLVRGLRDANARAQKAEAELAEARQALGRLHAEGVDQIHGTAEDMLSAGAQAMDSFRKEIERRLIEPLIAERDALAARLASAETDAVERHRLFNIAKDQRDIMAKRATRAEARLAAVEKLMAATITPSGGEGVVTVANLRVALATDTAPELTS